MDDPSLSDNAPLYALHQVCFDEHKALVAGFDLGIAVSELARGSSDGFFGFLFGDVEIYAREVDGVTGLT